MISNIERDLANFGFGRVKGSRALWSINAGKYGLSVRECIEGEGGEVGRNGILAIIFFESCSCSEKVGEVRRDAGADAITKGASPTEGELGSAAKITN